MWFPFLFHHLLVSLVIMMIMQDTEQMMMITIMKRDVEVRHQSSVVFLFVGRSFVASGWSLTGERNG